MTHSSFNQLAEQRSSCRSFDPEAEVSQADLESILAAARMAPSATNRQPWLFGIVRKQSEQSRQALRDAYNRDWFMQAPLHIVVCELPEQAWVRPFDGKNHADIDAAIATEHICLAATALGLGSCWVCNFDPEVLKNRLSLPAGAQPVAIIPIGVPAKDPYRAKSRKEMQQIIVEL